MAELTKLRGDVDALRREVADRDKTIETLVEMLVAVTSLLKIG
jgi:hypothetical protein